MCEREKQYNNAVGKTLRSKMSERTNNKNQFRPQRTKELL